jgi:hypothetical protein
MHATDGIVSGCAPERQRARRSTGAEQFQPCPPIHHIRLGFVLFSHHPPNIDVTDR